MDEEKVRKIRADRLKKLLEENNLKQCDLCQKEKDDGSGNTIFKESDISDWINGKRTLSEKKAEQLINEFFPGVRLEWLLGYDNDGITENDRICQYFDVKNIEADSMWPILNHSLKARGMELRFVHASHISPDATTRLDYGSKGLCWYEVTRISDGECVKKLSVVDVVTIEHQIQKYSDFLFFEMI